MQFRISNIFAYCCIFLFSFSFALDCTEQWQCGSVTQDFNFVQCLNSVCQCKSSLGFDGSATVDDPCRCNSPKKVYWESDPYCLSFEDCVATDNKKSKTKRECDYFIGEDDVNVEDGLVLSLPGTYCLTEDIKWSPKLNVNAAITIDNDNIRLDLKGHLLEQENSDTDNNIGIVVNNDTTNIVVMNGFITNFSGLGVYVKAGVNTIRITGLTIRECGYDGLFLDRLFTRPFAGGILVAGIDNSFVKNVIIEDCNIADLTCVDFPRDPGGPPPAGGCNGITVFRAEAVVIRRCRINHITSNDAAGLIFIGTIRTLTIEDCILTDAFGDRNANGIDSMFSPARRSTNVLIRNVHVANIRGVRTEGLGIEPNARYFNIRDCSVFNVSTANGLRCGGFVTQDNDGPGIYENCIVHGINGNVAGGPVAGFLNALGQGPSPTTVGTSQITFRNCEVRQVLGTGTPSAVGGLIDTRGRMHLVDGLRVSEVNSTNTMATIGGIVLIGTQFTTVTNSLLFNTQGNGIILHNVDTDITQFNTIKNNMALNNEFSGFNDQSSTNTNAFLLNYAQKNGNSPQGGANYLGIPPSVIRFWQLSNPAVPGGTIDPLANVDVQD